MSPSTQLTPVISPQPLIAAQQHIFPASGSQHTRPMRACDNCRQSKVKCDHQRPCSNCILRKASCTSRLAWKKRGPTQTSRTVPPFSINSAATSKERQKSPSTPSVTQECLTPSPTVWPAQGWVSDEQNVLENEPETGGHGLGTVISHQTNLEDSMVGICSGLYGPGMSHSLSNLPRTNSSPAAGLFLTSRSEEFWPECFTEEMILPWIDIFFDRLYPTLPLLDRTVLYRDMICRRHRKDRQYGAMILSLCAFSLIQPVHTQERQSMPSSDNHAKVLLDEALRLHSTADLGENPVLETVLTSFFMFGCLFGLQKHNAAWLKLREAIDVAAILCLQLPEAYTFLSDLERTQRLRVFFVLSVTERAYALQKHHEIEFKGRPGYIMRCLSLESASEMSLVGQSSEIDVKAMTGLSRMMALLDTVDESFIQCWNNQCGRTTHFDKTDALLIHRRLHSTSFSTTDQLFPGMTESQEIDIRVLGHWLMNRLWNMCLSHGLLSASNEEPLLCYQYGLTLAQEILQICKRFSNYSIDVHGIGIIERLYDIAAGAVSSLALTAQMSKQGELDSEVPAVAQDDASVQENLATLKEISELLGTLRSGEHPYLYRLQALILEYSPYPCSI